jgi:hypothetical protein
MLGNPCLLPDQGVEFKVQIDSDAYIVSQSKFARLDLV